MVITRKLVFPISAILLLTALFSACTQDKNSPATPNSGIRGLVDTVGFAHLPRQMDSIMARIAGTYGDTAVNCGKEDFYWKAAVSPHDDYTYAGKQYADVLKCVKARTIILFGVAHKAKKLGLENKIIFGTCRQWKAPYGMVKVSPLRDEIRDALPDSLYIISDKMMNMEHSLEAEIPFLQYYRRDIEIIPILVPYISYERMREAAGPLAEAILMVTRKENLSWGKDFAMVISTDAVHYGDEGWGGKNFARFGTDEKGTRKAVAYEYEIINHCLTGKINPEKIKLFTRYTVRKEDFRQYKWTWCGRYSVPFGLLTAYELQKEMGGFLTGRLLGYANSIDHEPIKVSDLGMGITAPANPRHWVGYAAIGYR
jgi:AmmeMemoRadiSam system protein B